MATVSTYLDPKKKREVEMLAQAVARPKSQTTSSASGITPLPLAKPGDERQIRPIGLAKPGDAQQLKPIGLDKPGDVTPTPLSGMGSGSSSSTTIEPASASTSTPSTTGTTSLIQPRPYSDEVRQLLNTLRERMGQTPTVQDIMNSPEYRAMEEAIRFNQQRAQAGLDRSFASRGMLRSTPMIQAAHESQAYYTAQLNQMIPQLLAQEYARRQQDLSNIANLLQTVAGLEDAAFNRGVTEFQTTAPYTRSTIAQQMDQERFNKTFEENRRQSDRAFGLQEAAVTGQYQPEAVRELLNTIVQAKESWFNPNDGTTPEQDNARANAARQALEGMGFSREQIDALVGPNVTPEQARMNVARFTVPTMQARQAEQNLRAGEIQQQLQQLELERARLMAEIERDPNIGLRAERERRIREIDAQIAATQALAAQRATRGGGQSQAQAADPEKIRQQAVKDLEVYDVTPTARNVWVDLKTEMDNIVAQTGTIDRNQAAQLLRAMLNVPGLTGKDKGFIAAMFASYFGDPQAAPYLQTFLKGYKPPETNPLDALPQ